MVTSLSETEASPARTQVVRIPRVRRLAYVRAVLRAIGDEGCKKEEAQAAVIQVVNELDAQKAAALGRKAPKPPKGGQLIEQCLQMTRRLGLTTGRGDQLLPTVDGLSLLRSSGREDLPLFFSRLWQTFPSFKGIVMSICDREEILVLPVNRYGGKFAASAASHGLHIDQMSFELVRDLGTELLVLNWHTQFTSAGAYQRVYATGVAKALSSLPPRADSGRSDSMSRTGTTFVPAAYSESADPGTMWKFSGNSVNIGTYEQSLWRQYLLITDRVPGLPVLYPELRDAVCESLRLPDTAFDTAVRELLLRPRRLNIYPAHGLLSYANKAAVTYKQVPPKAPSGQFMTFLRIDRKA